jgi:hypothetical protein
MSLPKYDAGGLRHAPSSKKFLDAAVGDLE